MIWVVIVLVGLLVYVFIWNTIRESKESEYNRTQAANKEAENAAVTNDYSINAASISTSKKQSSKKKKN